MVKQRLTTADVAGEVACLKQRIVGFKCVNLYDINPKTYVLKLARSGEDGEKILLLIESGVRMHTVQVMPPKSDTPSNFSLKLRKHVRNRRVESVRQLGVDRIVDLQFGTGDAACHLLLEFYAQGNVVLTDSKYEVLTLLRSHRDDAKGFAIMARHPYPIHTIRLRTPLAPDALEAALAAAGSAAAGGGEAAGSGDAGAGAGAGAGAEEGAGGAAGAAGGGQGGPVTLKGILSELLPYGPQIADHCILSAGLDPGRDPASQPLSGEERRALLGGVRGWERWLDECDEKAPEGFIYIKPGSGEGGAPPVYEEFEPVQLAQHAGRQALPPFPTFDAALDEFFGKIYGQRVAAASQQKEKAVVGKLEAIKKDHERRLQALQAESEAAELKARLIEYNLVAVDAALDSVREAVAAGMDWRDLGRMIKEERRAGNPVAGLIDSLQLDKNRVTLLLSNWLDEEEEDEEAATRPATKVEVDLSLSAHANARAYYDSRRKHQTKQAKTLGANTKALKAAEKKAQQQLSQARSAPVAVPVRKPYWFERFHWFISSENYLVLSGRDAQQNELLVKRYMRAGDIYVHADLHGASTTVVKNHQPGQPFPPLTLSQAGQACVCRSQAWDAKVVTSAWWVYPEQVSKTAPSGEYLTTGSFMIRGKKNYLPPQPLVMGFGFLFRLEDSCIAAHLGERAPRLVEGEGVGEQGGGGGAAAAEEEEEGEGSISEGGSDAEDGEEGEEGGSSALDAFMDASADRLARAPPAAKHPATSKQQQQQQQRGKGPAAAGGGAGDLASAFERYGLEDRLPAGAAGAGQEEEEDEDATSSSAAGGQQQQQQQAGRRHLSAKERQLMKKGKAPSGAPDASAAAAARPAAQQQQQQRAQGAGGKGGQGQQQQQAQQAQQGVRGKGGKGKKAKQRYADQDEDERELAMQVLQSAGQKKDKKDRKAERKQRMAARKAAKSGAPTQEITPEALAALAARPTTDTAEPSSGGEEEGEDATSSSAASEAASDAGDHGEAPAGGAEVAGAEVAGAELGGEGGGEAGEAATGSADGGGSGRGAGSKLQGGEAAGNAAQPGAAAGRAKGKQRRVEEEEDDEEDEGAAGGDEERDKQNQLDALTGCPRAEDILLFAVPVCAPYQVMAGYKFKVKLIPGSLKKGKAVRQATELLSRSAETTARERDLMKAAPEQDGINCLVGSVKLQMPGLQKMKQGQKSKKKK